MREITFLSAFVFLLSGPLLAQECTDQWDTAFETDPLSPKQFSGDTNAGYAIFSYWGNPDLKLELRGKFPKARFMSMETQSTRLSKSVDAILDYQIAPDAGSNRNFTLVLTAGKENDAHNQLVLADNRLAQSVMFRIYAPAGKLTRADLPRIFAFDRASGRSTSCPRRASYPSKFYFPQFLADLYVKFNPFEFKSPGSMSLLGLNQGASYLYAVSPMGTEDVILLRFRAPTSAQVRYWSFCTNNFPANQTLDCLADFNAHPTDGFVHMVLGRGNAVKAEAAKRGYDFLPDIRQPRQHVMGFVYRNLIPTADFKAHGLFQGDYVPTALECTAEEFIDGSCRW